MIVARKSSAECAASERSASEPENSPTTALAIVSAPDAAIEVSATRSFWSCMGAYLRGARKISSGFRHGVAVFANESQTELRRRGNVDDAADALAGRPDVLPGALFVVQVELLGRRRQVDIRGAGRID